jgi:glycosyltransferase involved in cell wall biosynthesis
MPVCNGQDTLEDAINAILAQTFADFELIISDCASSDRTEVICQSYAARDRRIRYVRNPVPIGAAGSYNRLVDLARGAYFKWVAHDDLIEPDYLEQCVAALDSDPGIVLAYARSQWIDARGNVVHPTRIAVP